MKLCRLANTALHQMSSMRLARMLYTSPKHSQLFSSQYSASDLKHNQVLLLMHSAHCQTLCSGTKNAFLDSELSLSVNKGMDCSLPCVMERSTAETARLCWTFKRGCMTM